MNNRLKYFPSLRFFCEPGRLQLSIQRNAICFLPATFQKEMTGELL